MGSSMDPILIVGAGPTGLVLAIELARRFVIHSFGDVKQFCDRHGKPLVRLPGGYSVNQVAAQVLSQCSGQLGGA